MEKQKSKNKFLKFLPRAASVVKFQNPTFSPDKLKTHAGKGFSGAVISLIPEEARRKPKNSITGFEFQEPTSPKISCMGQIKNKKTIEKKKLPPRVKDSKPVSALVEAKTVAFQNPLFSGAKPECRKSDASFDKSRLPDRAASLSQMRRFASGRESVRDFDWAAAEEEDFGCYYSDEESEVDKREMFIPFSAPILGGDSGGGGSGGDGGGAMEPRKEINLWKRRTMAQPSPLQIKSPIRS